MPNVVKAYGVHLVDDVVKIRDVTLTRPAKKKQKPRLAPRVEEEGAPLEGEEGQDFEALDLEPGEAEPEKPDFEQEDFEEEFDGEPSARGGYGAGVREEIIQSAMAEAGKILENAVHEAGQRGAEILAGIEGEVQQIRQQAADQGRLEGLQYAVGETKDIAAQIEQMVAVFEGERAGFEFEYEEQLKWLAFEIASKVLAKKVDNDDAEMLEMVDKAVQGVRNEPWVRVEVSRDMTHLIERLLALYKGSGNISVQPTGTDPGTVMVETPAGVIDASLKTQLENLRDYFTKFGNTGGQ